MPSEHARQDTTHLPETGDGRHRSERAPAVGATRHDQVDEAVMRERARTRAWLHDTVLQELEMLAAGAYADEPDPVAMAALAAGAADRLRRVIEGETPPAAGPLVDEIQRSWSASAGARTWRSGCTWAARAAVGDDRRRAADRRVGRSAAQRCEACRCNRGRRHLRDRRRRRHRDRDRRWPRLRSRAGRPGCRPAPLDHRAAGTRGRARDRRPRVPAAARDWSYSSGSGCGCRRAVEAG